MTITDRIAAGAAALSLLLAGPAAAQDAEGTVQPPHVAGPALWKVADEDTTIYLFGTVHVLPENIVWYRGTIADALESSDSLVTEIDTDAEGPGIMQQIVAKRGLLPEGQSLRDMLDERQRATYEAALARLGLPVGAFDRFEPWYGAMMLAVLPLLKQGYSPDAGVEKVLEAHAKGKDRSALETVDYQLSIFDELPQDKQIEFLLETAEGVDDIAGLLDKMVADWSAGDANDLATLMNEDMDDPILAQRLIYDRNANWARWIDRRLDQPGTVFVAVGAGHLAGAQSVQEKLATLGIATTRLQ